jgi:uncharacterized tellurite resistance protein B-like protein
MPANTTAIDRESLQQSLLIETVKLFALAARADEVISDSESAYVWQYFSRSYPPEVSQLLLEEFWTYAQEQLSMEEVASQCRARLAYEEKVFLLGKLLELLASDEITEEEEIFWGELGDQLGVALDDLKRLEALWLDKPLPRGHSTYLRWLWVTGLGEGGDVELRRPGLRLLLLRVKRRVLLLQTDDRQPISIDGERLVPHRLWRLPADQAIALRAMP